MIKKMDAAGIEYLFREHYVALCRYAHTVLKVQEQAEDIVQQLFVTLWEKREDLAVLENPRAYLYRSTHNRCLNEVKRTAQRRTRGGEGELTQVKTDHLATDRLMNRELEAQIEGAIQTLPEKCQEVFRLSRFEELSYKEIAEKLNVSVKTVENHMGKALRLMREELKEYLPALVLTILLMKGW